MLVSRVTGVFEVLCSSLLAPGVTMTRILNNYSHGQTSSDGRTLECLTDDTTSLLARCDGYLFILVRCDCSTPVMGLLVLGHRITEDVVNYF